MRPDFYDALSIFISLENQRSLPVSKTDGVSRHRESCWHGGRRVLLIPIFSIIIYLFSSCALRRQVLHRVV